MYSNKEQQQNNFDLSEYTTITYELYLHCQPNVLACHNKLKAFKKAGFLPVMGSLGFRRKSSGVHWEYGGIDWTTVADFMHHGRHDYHVWFEDDKGNIADIDWYEYNRVIKLQKCILKKTVNNPSWKIYTKKQWSDKNNFVYHQASPLVQSVIIRHWKNDAEIDRKKREIQIQK
jgi:hypothetical protein